MRAIAIDGFGGPERLHRVELPRPVARRGEALVRVVAAGVNPVDWKIREGRFAALWPHAFPLVPGWDLAGVVEELGEGTSRLRIGDRVWGIARKDVVQWGSYAEFAAVAESNLGLMPAELSFEEAAAMPVAGTTAWHALFSGAGLAPGSTVLVHAAAGGVGHLAVQLARNEGVRVLGTASLPHHEFVRSLGAEPIDRTAVDLASALRQACPDGVDLALDAAGGAALTATWGVMRRGARVVGIAEPPDPVEAERAGVRASYLSIEPGSEVLGLLARRVASGRLRPRLQHVYRLEQAAEAQRASAAGHVRGKLVLAV